MQTVPWQTNTDTHYCGHIVSAIGSNFAVCEAKIIYFNNCLSTLTQEFNNVSAQIKASTAQINEIKTEIIKTQQNNATVGNDMQEFSTEYMGHIDTFEKQISKTHEMVAQSANEITTLENKFEKLLSIVHNFTRSSINWIINLTQNTKSNTLHELPPFNIETNLIK